MDVLMIIFVDIFVEYEPHIHDICNHADIEGLPVSS